MLLKIAIKSNYWMCWMVRFQIILSNCRENFSFDGIYFTPVDMSLTLHICWLAFQYNDLHSYGFITRTVVFRIYMDSSISHLHLSFNWKAKYLHSQGCRCYAFKRMHQDGWQWHLAFILMAASCIHKNAANALILRAMTFTCLLAFCLLIQCS